jgi:NAD+ synthase (glutamine-hydrolysing)
MKDSLLSLGFLRSAVISPELHVADVDFNTHQIISALREISTQSCRLAVFPELCLTGYSCADLFFQSLLLSRARSSLLDIARAGDASGIAAIVGLPLEVNGRIYNCAAFMHGGQILGIVPKTYLPTANEYYERRWFTSGQDCTGMTIRIGEQAVLFGTDLLFRAHDMVDCTIGIEICEDLWAVEPPSGDMALAGATVIANLSASDELLGKAEYRRELVKQQSARCISAYLYADAGPGESTTDVVFAGHSFIAENGTILTETERYKFSTQIAVTDVDLQRITHERWLSSSFTVSKSRQAFRIVTFQLEDNQPPVVSVLRRSISSTPFVPSDLGQRARHCQEIFNIQSTGLAKRIQHIHTKNVSLAISGGLDSTLALLVTCRAFDLLGLSRQGIVATSMPGFGTTSRTRTNAERLAELLGVTFRLIPIVEAVRQHFRDIGHEEARHDITYENAQARERTQVLMDVANQINGLAVGTGDLSELALGWCTYNGDQMSMYHVNAGVPKTLVRYMIEWCAESEYLGETANVLHDICATPITPELLPIGDGDKIQQETETTIGPYVLHDFFLFYIVRYGFSPRKVFFLSRQAFEDNFQPAEILKWMKVFYTRFFANQFKRSAMPDGPKVGSVALSPRGDWRMPSDACVAVWLEEVDEITVE